MHNDDLFDEMAELYSNHYGEWSSVSPYKPGEKIRLSATRIKQWASSDDTKIAIASHGDKIIGYAIALQSKIPKYGVVSWVTQFVIHIDHRNKGVGKALLFSIWGFSNHFSWGLVTANPYAVRALEKATRRRCSSQRIKKNYRKLLAIGAEHVPYINAEIECKIDNNNSQVNTKFYLDHSELKEMLESVVSDEKPWLLGDLREGWEWLAFTFNDQGQFSLTSAEIDMMLEASEDVAKHAYSRMLLDSPSQKWTAHTPAETEFIAKTCSLPAGGRILDFGCGLGRHAIALAQMGYDITGVDYVSEFVISANDESKAKGLNARFISGDCRTVYIDGCFDLILSLYDVIGTFAENDENIKIVQNISRHLRSGGKALISVMNHELTERRAKTTFDIKTEYNKLLELDASKTMEQTGDIFNPDYYLLDNKAQVVYRREQFANGGSLPVELIVRDRRFIKEEIEGICRSVGLKVVWSRFVRAGKWDVPLEREDNNAKEILILCEK